MDEGGVDLQVLSHGAPAAQKLPPEFAVQVARETNDRLQKIIETHPTRFAGFATLPTADAKAAADELERTVTKYNFKGAMIHGLTNGTEFLDKKPFWPVFERAQALDVPLYLHPATGVDTAHVLSGHPELIGPMWSWGVDTSTHVLRLIFSGVFDNFPAAKLLLGHMGEGLPYALWRLDSRWDFHDHKGIELGLGYPSEYLRRNLWVTTSGVCSAEPLRCAVDALGADRVMFATDYPFEDLGTACSFIETVQITEDDRERIAYRNAEEFLRLSPVAP
jgi:2,3-dihydroxybenzoate decarboxylase